MKKTIKWSNIVDNTLVSTAFNAVLQTGYKIVYGVIQQAVNLIGTTVKITPNIDSCLVDLSTCGESGITIRIRIQYTILK